MELTLADQSVFRYIVERYQDKLRRYIRRLTNVSDEEEEDILQDIFIKTYQNLNGFDRDLKFSSWIYRIAHNAVISNFRKTKARPQTSSIDVDSGLVNRLAADIDIEKGIDRELLKKHLAEILTRLDRKYQEVLQLRFLEEKDYKEISDIIKKPPGTVATLINRGKDRLKRELLADKRYTRLKSEAF